MVGSVRPKAYDERKKNKKMHNSEEGSNMAEVEWWQDAAGARGARMKQVRDWMNAKEVLVVSPHCLGVCLTVSATRVSRPIRVRSIW